MIFHKKRPTIGLALGGGAAKGYAHIGVIKALEKHAIPIDYIAGSSVGSLVGGLYSATKDIAAIERLALQTTNAIVRSFLLDPSMKYGFIKGIKFNQFIKNYIGDISFEELKIPFAATTTDLHTGQTVILQDGNVSEAIQTSCAIPLLFKPLEKGKQLLTDGGISMPVPVKVVKDMGADIIIAVNLCEDYYDENMIKNIGFKTIFLNTYGIMAHHLANEHMKQADIQVSPRLKHIDWKLLLHDDQKYETINIGEKYMEAQIQALKALLKREDQGFFTKMITFIKNPFQKIIAK